MATKIEKFIWFHNFGDGWDCSFSDQPDSFTGHYNYGPFKVDIYVPDSVAAPAGEVTADVGEPIDGANMPEVDARARSEEETRQA